MRIQNNCKSERKKTAEDLSGISPCGCKNEAVAQSPAEGLCSNPHPATGNMQYPIINDKVASVVTMADWESERQCVFWAGSGPRKGPRRRLQENAESALVAKEHTPDSDRKYWRCACWNWESSAPSMKHDSARLCVGIWQGRKWRVHKHGP